MKFFKLIALFSLLLLPQIHQAWGGSHCINDCHEKESLNAGEEQAHQETSSKNSQQPEKENSHQHAHHCTHSYAVVISFTSFLSPYLEYKTLGYHFTLYESEPHLNVFIEPPIPSRLIFA